MGIHLESTIVSACVTVAIAAGAATALAFYRPTQRFMKGSALAADVLAAGIFTRALGTIFAGAALLGRAYMHWDTFSVYFLGWILVIVGYYLHLSAWRCVYLESRRVFSIEIASLLAIIGAASFFWFYLVAAP